MTLNIQKLITPAPTVVKPVKQNVAKTKTYPKDTELTKILEEMTKTPLTKVANKPYEENNATRVSDKASVLVAIQEIKPPQKTKVIKKTKTVKKTKAKQKVIKTKKTIKKVVKKKKRIKKRKIHKSKDPLANMLMNASTKVIPKRNRRNKSNIKMIKQFYGKEFNSFTPTQKKFIEKNLGSIYRITQRTLTHNGYPSTAVRTHQQGTNIVTFYLHPNGDISHLRLKRRIGYASLDKNTLRTIRIAYKNYPLPKTKTKITFYVEYNLY